MLYSCIIFGLDDRLYASHTHALARTHAHTHKPHVSIHTHAGFIHFMFENSCLGVIIALTQIYLFLWIAHRIAIVIAAAAAAAVVVVVIFIVVVVIEFVACMLRQFLNYICTSSMFNATHESSNNEQMNKQASTRREGKRQNII